MLRLKGFCSLPALEVFTTEHSFICLHRHESVLFLFPPSLIAPGNSTELALPAVRLVSEPPRTSRRQRAVAGPMAKFCLGTSLGTHTRKVTALPSHPRPAPARLPQAGRLRSGDGAGVPGSPRTGQRARREPLQHLPAGRAIREVSAGLRLPATNNRGRSRLSRRGRASSGEQLWRRCRDTAGAGRRSRL